MAQPNFYAAVYAIIRNEQGEVLFSERKNTTFKNGKYQLPAGHMDGNESMVAAMVRELKEELSITVREEDLRVVHISHRLTPEREYFDAYVEVLRFTGTPSVNEPDKCGGLHYVSLSDISDERFVRYDADAIQMADRGITFSEMNMKDYE